MSIGDLVACEHLYGLVLKVYYGTTHSEAKVYWLNNIDDGTYSRIEWCAARYLVKIQ
jgi:hypothetical protein